MTTAAATRLRSAAQSTAWTAIAFTFLSLAAHALGNGFSPDGTRLLAEWRGATADSPSIVMVDIASGRLRRIAETTRESGAQWSPDGHWIVYQSAETGDLATRLYDVRKGTSSTISRRFGPPYAWREDSRRLAGVSRDEDVGLQVVFYDLRERGESLRAMIPVDSVRSMVWLPNTDDVAYLGVSGGKSDVYSVEGGEPRRISTSGDVMALQLVRARDELVWARPSRNARYILLSLYAFHLKTRSVRRLAFPEKVAGINPVPARGPSAVDAVVISPRGDRIAVIVADVRRAGAASVRQQRLFTVRNDGTGARLVRTIPQAGPTNSMVPFWSLDSGRLGVLHREGSRLTLAMFGGDGADGRVLAKTD